MLKKTSFVCIILFTFVSFLLSENQQKDGNSIPKGQFLPAPEIIRSQTASKSILATNTIFEETFETGGTDWSTTGSFEIGIPSSRPGSAHSSSNCAATNLTGDYINSANDWLISRDVILPSTSESISLFFWEWFQIESGWDYGKVQLSTDGGSNWTLLDSRDGSSDWRETIIDLTSYAGETIKIVFQFTSDGSYTYSGWYIDDIQVVLEQPEPLSAAMVSLNHQTFPFIYMNAAVDTFGIGFPDLTQSNFEVYENNVLQTDYFEVTPPEIGAGSRLTDIIFLMDNSGSMDEEINAVSNNVIDFVDNLSTFGIDFALGLCRYGQSGGGIPIIEDNGILTQDAYYFKYTVWNRNNASGSFEPGYYAVTQSASNFSFRPGAQKIFIIITDETPGQGYSTMSDALSVCTNNSITLFALTESDLYGDFEPITSATNGAYFDIYSNFDDILNYISSQVANTYLIRYYSSDPVENGIERNVEVVVNYGGNQATATGSYTPGSAPHIQRTQNTIDLHDQAWAAGTSFTIQVEITDDMAPFTQNATLYFKTTSNAVYQSEAMTNSSGNIWEADIDGSNVVQPGIDYYISATDNQSTATDPATNPSTVPYQIAILPNVAPAILHSPVMSLILNTAITITAEITDNTNYLNAQGLFYRKTGQLLYQNIAMTNTSGNTFQAEIPASYITSDGVDYYIKATDNFGVSGYSGFPDNPHTITYSEELTPPTNLTAEITNLVDGEVLLNWNYGTGEGFYEDFEDGVADNWVPVTGNWSLSGNTYNVNSNTDYTVCSSYYSQDFSNFELEVKMRKTSGDNFGLGIYFNSDPSEIDTDGDWKNFYHFYFSCVGDWNLGKMVNGEWSFIQEWLNSSALNIGLGAWNTLKVVSADGYIDVYFNDVLQGSYYDDTFLTGKVGLKMYDPGTSGSAEFDYVKVTPLTASYTFRKVQQVQNRNIHASTCEFLINAEKDGDIIGTEIAPRPIYGEMYTYKPKDNKDGSTFQHFNVYRDGSLIANPSETTYLDDLPEYGTYEFEVTAYYAEGESEPAGPVVIEWDNTTTLSGHVTDATTGDPIESASVSLSIISDITDSDGYYLLEDVPPGVLTAEFMGTPRSGEVPLTVQFTDLSTSNTQTVTATASGYIDYINQQVQIIENQNNQLDISLSPVITEGELRFVLSWDDDPADLDSHLKTPDIEGQQYHVFFAAPGSSTQPPYAVLDVDDVTGWGPETITIFESYPGTYSYYIYKWAGNEEIIQSNAVIQIYNDTGLLETLHVPTSGTGRFWYVCDINGSTQNITLVNEICVTEPGFITMTQNTDKPKSISYGIIQSSDIVSWQWDFGDGNGSTEQNPQHTYSELGDYTVSLTVSDGTNSDSETKVDYISVEEVSEEIVLKIPPTEGSPGCVVGIPIIANSGFSNVAMIQLQISYCTDLLTYTGMSSGYGLTTGDVNNAGDHLNIVWVYSGTPMEVPDGGTLILLNFQVNVNAVEGQTCDLTFTGENNLSDPDENAFTLNLQGGTFTVIEGYTISGLVSYCETDIPIANTQISLTGDTELNTNTDALGNYQLDEVQGDVTLTASKSDENGDINGFDLLRLKNILLGVHTPTTGETWAGDCNGDEGVNGFDLLRLKNYLLGIAVDPPIATWGFDPGNYSYRPIDADKADQDFAGVIFGDVTLSWGSSSSVLAKSTGDGRIDFGGYCFDAVGNIHVPITSDRDLMLGMLDWSIEFDSTLFTLESLNSRFLEQGDCHYANGQIKIVWVYLGEEEIIHADESICELILMPLSEHGIGKLSFVGENYLANGNEEPYDFTYVDIQLNLMLLSISENGALPTETTLYPNYPNPFNPRTMISYYLKENGDVTVHIFNLRGESQRSYHYPNQAAGFYQLEWNGKDSQGLAVPSGIYFYQLRHEGFSQMKRMVLMK